MIISEHLRPLRVKPGQQVSYETRTLADHIIHSTTQTDTVRDVYFSRQRGHHIVFEDSQLFFPGTPNFPMSAKDIEALESGHRQHAEREARLAHVAARIFHEIVPAITEGRVVTPESLGYCYIDSRHGYAQRFVRLEARIATFKDNGEENNRIRDTQQLLQQHAAALGLPPATDGILPCFAKHTFFIAGTGSIVWQPILAIGTPLNTAALANTLETMADVCDSEQCRKLRALLDLYTELQQPAIGPDSFATSSPEHLTRPATFGPHRDNSAEHRSKKVVLEDSLLWGMKLAQQRGLISVDEYNQALQFIPKNELQVYLGLQTWFVLQSRLLDMATVPFIALIIGAWSVNPAIASALAMVINIGSASILRSVAATLVGSAYNVNLRQAALFALIPVLGNYGAIPLQAMLTHKDQADDLRHYTLRALIAKISALHPHGGWNSEIEEVLWNNMLRAAAQVSLGSELASEQTGHDSTRP